MTRTLEMLENLSPLSDEDTFVIPDVWRTRIDPRRGGVTGPRIELDPNAVAAVRELTRVHLNVDLHGDQRLVDAARAHLEGEVTPLGAAVVAAVVCDKSSRDADRVLFADAWVADHGVVFAAEATVHLTDITFDTGHVRHWVPSAGPRTWARRTITAWRLRSILAAAANADYQDAVDALAHRRGSFPTKLTASYLLPTQLDWADEVLAAALAARHAIDHRMLFGIVGTTEHLTRVSTHHMGMLLTVPRFLLTVLDAVGPSIAPTVARLLDRQEGDVDDRKFMLEVLGVLPTDEAFELLLARVETSHVAPALLLAMNRCPVRALRLLARAASDRSNTGAIAAELFRGHVLANPELAAAARPVLPVEVRAVVDQILDSAGLVKEAREETLPQLLAEPPWIRKRTVGKPVVVADLAPTPEHAVVWAHGEQQAWAAPAKYWSPWYANTDWDEEIRSFQDGRLSDYRAYHLFADAPERLVRPLLADWRQDNPGEKEVTKRIVARHGLDAFPFALHLARTNPASHGEVLVPFVSAEVAELMADWLVRLKSARSIAVRWFGRHGSAAARLLVPAALGEPGSARSNAEAALRFIAAKSDPTEVVAIAREYGEQAASAIEALLGSDPMEARLPARMPKVGNWVDVRVFPRVLLRDREHVLPFTAIEHVVTMLALSKPDEVYPGVDMVKELCDPDSLAEFGWALFQRWRFAGLPPKDGWALNALAWIGNDDTVRRLTPVIRAWPGQGGHSRAATGLEVLSSIGTEVALTHLNRIARRVKFKGIKTRAQEKINQLAVDLGLTADQLADRLVPDFGLDASGSMPLGYGRRRFTVGFDEQLKPYVLDENGKRLRSLPKPVALDDDGLAAIARERFAALKKDVRSTATEQIGRLKLAMVTQRRWTAAEFRQLFVEHPLLWHIVRRLLWTSEHGRFRIAEDRTFADVNDDALTLSDTDHVAVAHPAMLGDKLGAWAEIFADYEILQPFPQLGHPVHQLTDEERASTELKRFHDITVPHGKVIALRGRGWRRPELRHRGVQAWMFKPVHGNRTVVIGLEPDTRNQGPKAYPDERITSVWISDSPEGDSAPGGVLTFDELDPVTASELLTDLTDLTV